MARKSEIYAIYLRKSRSDSQLEANGIDVLETHYNTLIRLAKSMNLSIGKIYREVVSGDSISARPEMQHLLREVESGMYSGVLVMEIERLARGDTIDQGTVQRSFQYSDTKIITPTKIYDPKNEFDQEYFEFGLFMSRREYQTIKRRMRAGVDASVRDGKWPFNKAPYGYKTVKLSGSKGFSLEIIEEEAYIVRLVYALFTGPDRIGISMIRNYLDDHSIPTRSGRPWSPATIRDMLRNPVYDKKVSIGKTRSVTRIKDGIPEKIRPRHAEYDIYEGLHERMIEHDVWIEAQSYLGKGKKKLPELYSVKNPLAGLVRCSKCGSVMIRRPKRNTWTKGGCNYDMLLCNTHGCSTVGCSLDLVENDVICALNDWVKGYELTNTIELPDRIPELTAMLSTAHKTLDSLLSQKGNLYDLLEQGVYSVDVFTERQKLLSEKITAANDSISDIQSQIEEESNRKIQYDSFIPATKSLLGSYWSLNAQERNKALKMLLDSIVYTKDKRNKKGEKDVSTYEIVLKPKIPKI